MDIQDILSNAIDLERFVRMKTSEQLMLIELIMKLDAIANKDKLIVFDDGKFWPERVDSWRGSYAELALEYCSNEELMLIVSELLADLKDAVGKTFRGYKGGDFIMGKNTPLWVACYGTAAGFKHSDDGYQAVVGVVEDKKVVRIKTAILEY